MKKVLVVDDTKNIRMILTKCLELEGYEVTTSSDGKQALDLLTSSTFDLIFLDIKLPEIRGTEVFRRLRDLGIKTPVIIITAYATVKNAVDCTNMGAVAYLQKPFSSEKIRSVLKDLDTDSLSLAQNKNVYQNFLTDAKLALDKGDFNKALDFSKKALAIELNDPEVYLFISKSYDGLKDIRNANRFLQFYETFNS
jgi:Response regulator containing CheY-like receiver, AAA-type ATPase, and DNA-binding domains